MKPADVQTLTQVEFTPEDHETAARIAAALGYEQHAYTSTSDLWGAFCLPENPERARWFQPTHGACIIKTRELGFLVVQSCEDLGLTEDGFTQSARELRGRR